MATSPELRRFMELYPFLSQQQAQQLISVQRPGTGNGTVQMGNQGGPRTLVSPPRLQQPARPGLDRPNYGESYNAVTMPTNMGLGKKSFPRSGITGPAGSKVSMSGWTHKYNPNNEKYSNLHQRIRHDKAIKALQDRTKKPSTPKKGQLQTMAGSNSYNQPVKKQSDWDASMDRARRATEQRKQEQRLKEQQDREDRMRQQDADANRALIESLAQAEQEANQANEQRYQDILQGYRDSYQNTADRMLNFGQGIDNRYAQAMAGMNGLYSSVVNPLDQQHRARLKEAQGILGQYTDQRAQDIRQNWDNNAGMQLNDLRSRGLGATSVLGSTRRANERNKQADLNRLNDLNTTQALNLYGGMSGERLGMLGGFGQNQLNANYGLMQGQIGDAMQVGMNANSALGGIDQNRLGFMERRTDNAADLAQYYSALTAGGNAGVNNGNGYGSAQYSNRGMAGNGPYMASGTIGLGSGYAPGSTGSPRPAPGYQGSIPMGAMPQGQAGGMKGQGGIQQASPFRPQQSGAGFPQRPTTGGVPQRPGVTNPYQQPRKYPWQLR